jgi:uncharacterized protein YcfJ
LFKSVVGVTVGGVAGMIFFKSGNGNRAATIATALGVAAGSTYERIVSKAAKQQQQQQQQQA